MKRGFVLTELLVAGLIASFVVLGLVQMAAASSRSLQLVEELSASQQGGRFALDQVRDAIMGAGYQPTPWDSTAVPALGASTTDGGTGGSDVLTLQQLSDHNCFGTANPVTDATGHPAFYLRESTFERNASANLAHTCFYGPPGGVMVRQINLQGLVQGVESFQVLYAEDRDGDRRPETRVRAGHWQNKDAVVAIEVGLLLAGDEELVDDRAASYIVLDEAVTPVSDGQLRRVWRATFPIGSKLR